MCWTACCNFTGASCCQQLWSRPKTSSTKRAWLPSFGRSSRLRKWKPASSALCTPTCPLVRLQITIVTWDFFNLGIFIPEPTNYKGPTPEDQEFIKQAQQCVKECHLEHLVTESKFLRLDSLQEMVKVGERWSHLLQLVNFLFSGFHNCLPRSRRARHFGKLVWRGRGCLFPGNAHKNSHSEQV